jgi:hypothetical protein
MEGEDDVSVYLKLQLTLLSQTLAVLHAVDPSIVDGYQSWLLQATRVQLKGDQ